MLLRELILRVSRAFRACVLAALARRSRKHEEGHADELDAEGSSASKTHVRRTLSASQTDNDETRWRVESLYCTDEARERLLCVFEFLEREAKREREREEDWAEADDNDAHAQAASFLSPLFQPTISPSSISTAS